jgi:hypothetical protein
MAIFAQYDLELQQWPEKLRTLVVSYCDAKGQLNNGGKIL